MVYPIHNKKKNSNKLTNVNEMKKTIYTYDYM